jgi:hypothetical protein
MSFGFGFKEKTKLTTSLLIAGGALLIVSKLVEPTLGLNLYLAISLPYLYITLIAIGCILDRTRSVEESSKEAMIITIRALSSVTQFILFRRGYRIHMLSFHEIQTSIPDRVIPFILALQRRVEALEEQVQGKK